MTFQTTASKSPMNSGWRSSRSRLKELMDVIFLFMASVPFALFGLQTKNIHWDTDTIFDQQQSEMSQSDPATCPTAPPVNMGPGTG